MKKLFSIILLLPTLLAYSQSTSDPHLVLGFASKDAFFGKEIKSYCTPSLDKHIKKGSPLFISGANVCESLQRKYKFFEVVFKNEVLYTEESNIISTNKNLWDKISSLSQNEKDSVRFIAKKAGQLWDIKSKKDAIDFLNKTKTHGLSILKFSCYDESEHTEGTGFKVNVYNPTNKTIKYIWFNIVGYNPVGDKVVSKGKSVQTVRGVGPIKPEGTGEYEFEYVWFTDMVEAANVASIKVQYMDGSFKTILTPKSITMPNAHYDYLFE